MAPPLAPHEESASRANIKQAKDLLPASEIQMLQADTPGQHVGPSSSIAAEELVARSAVSKPSRVPEPVLTLKLWGIFLENVDPLVKVLHVPTAEARIMAAIAFPNKADDSQAMLLYAICYAAITTLDHQTVHDTFEVHKIGLLKKFGDGVEQYVTKFSLIANPNLEYITALIIHLVRRPFNWSALLTARNLRRSYDVLITVEQFGL